MSAVALHHEEAGPPGAPTLLLAPSLGTTLELWDPLLPALARAHRVIRIDARGHGRSPVPPGPYDIADLGADALALLDRLEIARAAFCGISLGAMTGLWLAAEAPERIERLVACCTSAHLPPPSAWEQRAGSVRAAGSTAPIADAVLARWLTPAFAASDAGAPVLARLRAMLLASPADGYAACCEAVARLDLRAQLPAIAAPTLVVTGAQDEATPPVHGEAIAAAIPGARLARLDPAAHLACAERPEALAALILDHLAPAEEP